MVLMNHGLFSFGQSARESYERMIALVTRAQDYLKRHGAWDLATTAGSPPAFDPVEIAALRCDISAQAGGAMIVGLHQDPRSRAFARHTDVARISQQGPITPDHVIRTKCVPMLGRDVAKYARAYRDYFDAHAAGARTPVTMLDPAPRVVLDPALGMLAVGRSARDAAVVRDLYAQTMDVIERAERLGGYRALPAQDIFDVEYWELEQAKLKRGAKPPVFTGEVALVTGAASGIGRACVEALLARGAAVAALDIDPAITSLWSRADVCGIACDVTVRDQLRAALIETVRAFGGLDMLILNAGIFPAGKRIAELDDAEWQRVMAINLDANLALLRDAHALLRLAPRHGRVVVIGSKNVPAPGPGAAAYSASKAALNQLARVAALEWGADGIRVNSLHPNAVFDTGIWTDEVLAARAAHYGLSIELYKRRNVLGVEVTSRDVAELAAELCGPLFAKTTGAQLPVDGGNERVI
jgi:NAD(P)-dependent dehydrogenase (short-subunit alcohol dehydrogenase family)